MRRRDPSAITDGTAQDARFPAPLEDHYFDVDERRLPDMLARTAEFAKFIRYYSLDNRKDGSWKELFASDEAVVMADIVTTDSTRMETEFLPWLENGELAQAARYLVGFARRIDGWYRRLLESEEDSSRILCQQIGMVVERKLQAALRAVAGFVPEEGSLDSFQPMWRIDEVVRRARFMERSGRDPARAAALARQSAKDKAAAAKTAAHRAREAANRAALRPGDAVLMAQANEAAEAALRAAEAARDAATEAKALAESEGPAPGKEPGKEKDAEDLRESFYSMVSAVSYLTRIADDRLQESLRSGNHDPALALFIAFARLMDKARFKANLFTARHRDFYYGEALKIAAKPQTPDSTFLLFEPDSGRASLTIPAGTDFTAGKAGGDAELLYRSETTIDVTDARVHSLLTLYGPRDPQISPEHELDYVNGFRTAEVGLHGNGLGLSAAGPNPPSASAAPSWPLFGADRPGAEKMEGEDASVGFAIACSALVLREGDRTITVTMSFQLPATSGELSFGDRFGNLILGRRRPTRGGDGFENADSFQGEASKRFRKQDLLTQKATYIFYRVLGNAFNVAVSTAPGWHEIDSYAVEASGDGAASLCRLSFTLQLGPEVPALAPCDPAVHCPGYGTGFPVLRFLLNPRSSLYAYSLFARAEVEEIAIESTVKEATNTVAWNQFGQLDTSKPFNPFGPLPTTNSYLIVGNRDAAAMNLTSLDLNIEWGDLPGGFKEYYRGYETPFTNESFQAETSVLRDGRWRPAKDEPKATTALFASEDGALAAEKKISLDVLRYFRKIDPGLPADQFRYDQKARGGFFRLSLSAPETGFGHREYPGLLTKVLSGNAQGSRWLRLGPGQQPLPNAAYTPVINRISMDYTALSSIGVGAGGAADMYADKVYRLHPFNGVETIDTNRPWCILPQLEFDGNLFIGFSATNPAGLLTLLFQLREDSVSAYAATPDSGASTPVTIQYSPNLTIDTSLADVLVTLEGDVVSINLTRPDGANIPAGTRCYIRFRQNAKGGWKVRLPENVSAPPGFAVDDSPLHTTVLPLEYNRSKWIFFGANEPVYWSYLASDEWRDLGATNILSDTTDGFLSSGIVALSVPADIDRQNTIMPRDLYWLRVSARRNFGSFCSLYDVQAQAVLATRVLSEKAPWVLPKPLPPDSIKGPVSSIAGLRAVSQPLPSSHGREAETPHHKIARSSERLRHKARASTTWDFERLVLEEFPEVFKVKCFRAMTSRNRLTPDPGAVLVVVVPWQTQLRSGVVFDPMLDAIQLKRIQEFLRGKAASAQVRIEVRNPTYERVLIRCMVRLSAEATRRQGNALRDLNQTLVDYISPWSNVGPPPRFGWSFDSDEVQAFIRSLRDVDFVTQFSMLHLTQDDAGSYRLDDTARTWTNKARAKTSVNLKISPRFPWSLAIPNPTHILDTTDETGERVPAITGIGKLRIGNTFTVVE